MRWICLVLMMFVYTSLESLGAFCGGLDHGPTTQQGASAVPLVLIEGVSTFSQDRPLAFRCKIRNPGSKPLYVYSALLQSPQFAEVVLDRTQKLIEVRFSRLQPSPIVPYYFPPAAFRKITANDPANFDVTFNTSLKELRGYEIINGTSREARVAPGTWTVRILIGYGYDVSDVKLALPSNAAGEQHPINAIVKWQKVVLSNSVTINVMK